MPIGYQPSEEQGIGISLATQREAENGSGVWVQQASEIHKCNHILEQSHCKAVTWVTGMAEKPTTGSQDTRFLTGLTLMHTDHSRGHITGIFSLDHFSRRVSRLDGSCDFISLPV